jgi:hypothetical protein
MTNEFIPNDIVENKYKLLPTAIKGVRAELLFGPISSVLNRMNRGLNKPSGFGSNRNRFFLPDYTKPTSKFWTFDKAQTFTESCCSIVTMSQYNIYFRYY